MGLLSLPLLMVAARLLIMLLAAAAAKPRAEQYPRLELPRRGALQSDDWLITRDGGTTAPNTSAQLLQLDHRTVALSNNLVVRVFTLEPEWSTWDIVSAGQGSALRAPAPEAMVTLDDTEYAVGGLTLDLNGSGFASCSRQSVNRWYPTGQHAEACPTGWWNRSLPLLSNTSAFRYKAHDISAPVAPFEWRPARHAPAAAWPPKGIHLAVNFTAPASAPTQHRSVIVTVHYQLLDGAPIFSKWVSVHRPALVSSPAALDTQTDLAGALAGALSIQPCSTNPANVPAEWGFFWVLPPQGMADTAVKLGGKSSARDLCMSVITAPNAFPNADVGLRPCNKSNLMQRWAWNKPNGTLQTLASPAALKEANIKGCIGALSSTPASCCLDINGHVNASGQAMQMDSCRGVDRWGSFSPLRTNLGTMLQSTMYPGSCVFSTPLPPPPPPAPPPSPRADCQTGVGGDCLIVSHVVVEILRLNSAWASTERAMPYEQTDITQDVLPFDATVGTGLLHIRPSVLHGSSVLWSIDMTFRDPDYVPTNNAGAVPTVVVGYQSKRSCNITKQMGNYNQGECQHGGPGYRLTEDSADFSSFKALQVWSDSAEPERKGLGRRAMARMLAPQSQEAPFTFHTGTTDEVQFKTLVDQLSNVGGFDTLMMSFGSGFEMEDVSSSNLDRVGELIRYARAHNLEVGGYDLIDEKTPTAAEADFATIDPVTNRTSGSLCFASGWRRALTAKVLTWVDNHSLTAVETDGPYGGAVCASTSHDHYDADDSIYMQQQGQVEFYQSLRSRGVYVNAPDDYLYEGGANKICGGYTMFSSTRPHWEMLQIQRIQAYDQLFIETPSMEWMLAPLDPYGGPDNGLEPLSQHITAYNWTLGSYLGLGLSGACFRGHRVYDSPAVEAMVKRWTMFWQRHRVILAKDVIHLRRPDYQSIDAVMHVDGNLSSSVCALIMAYNPTDFKISTTLQVDLWYTGESARVFVSEPKDLGDSKTRQSEQSSARATPEATLGRDVIDLGTGVEVSRDFTIPLSVDLPAREMTYFVVTRGGGRQAQSAGSSPQH